MINDGRSRARKRKVDDLILPLVFLFEIAWRSDDDVMEREHSSRKGVKIKQGFSDVLMAEFWYTAVRMQPLVYDLACIKP